MTDAPSNPDDYCYRHPDRLSFVLCEKCGRTICLECQTHVNGKVLCPDDAARSNVTMLPVNRRPPTPKRVRTQPRWLSWLTDRVPIVTLSLMALIAVLWLADIIVGAGQIEFHLWLLPAQLNAAGTTPGNGAFGGPWTLVTSMISSPAGGDGFISVVFSLFSIFVLGRILEREFGRLRFLAIYVLSGLGASVFALLFVGIVQSASGAIFGMVAAFVVLMRKRGVNMIWLYAIIALNIIAIALSTSRAVIWQGAVGGLVIGLAVGFTLLRDETPQQQRQQRLILVGIGVVLVAAAVIRSLT
jgi:membrane associated rhomboid family serine protease